MKQRFGKRQLEMRMTNRNEFKNTVLFGIFFTQNEEIWWQAPH
jgi:hypothetical protein